MRFVWLAAWQALNTTFTKGRKSYCRSHCPRSRRRGSAAARFLGVRERIPPAVLKFVSCECCVLSGRVLCVGLITCPTECGVPECDHEASTMRWSWFTGAVAPKKERCFIERLRRLIPEYAKRRAEPFHCTKQTWPVLIHSTKYAGVWGHDLDL